MSYSHRKGSVNVGSESRRASIQPLLRDGPENVLPPSVDTRRNSTNITFSNGRRVSNLKNLAGSTSVTNSETVYLLAHSDALSWRRYLVGPIIFAYIAAYMTLYSTFGLYTYDRIQKAMFPNETFTSTSKCDADTNSTNYKHQIAIQEKASTWNTYFAVASGVPAIFANIILGSITDRFGRKFLFVLPCLGTLTRCVFTTIGFHYNFKLEYFLIGNFIEGLTGQLFTILLVSFTYVSDITPQKGTQRSFAIAMIELSIGIGVAGFGFSTGYFIQNQGFFYPMLSTIPIFCLSLFLVLFLPESFPSEKRSAETNLTGTIKTAYDLFFGEFNRGRRWMYHVLMSVFLICMFSVFGRTSTDTLYQLDEPFCWSPEKLGDFTALRSGLQQMAGMVLVKFLQKALSDEAIAIVGGISFTASFVMEGLAKSDIVLYIVPVVGSLGMLTIPMVRALMSKQTRSDQQGAVFASIAAVETAVNLGGAVISNVIYAHTVSLYRGTVYFVFAACNIVCVVLMGIYRFGSRRTYPILDVRE